MEGELDQGRQLLARAYSRQGRADATNAAGEHEVLERLRLELESLEKRLGAEVSRARCEVKDEQRSRERAARETEARYRRDCESRDEHLRGLERAVQDLLSREPPSSSKHRRVGEPPPVSSESSRHAPASAAASADQLATLEARLEQRLARCCASERRCAEACAETAGRERRSLSERLEQEREARTALEVSVSKALDAAVRGLARATAQDTRRIDSYIDFI